MKRTLLTAIAVVAAGASLAASHNDAPLVTNDPAANITDVYAFVRNNAQGVKVLNLAMNVNPLEDPGNGVIVAAFDLSLTGPLGGLDLPAVLLALHDDAPAHVDQPGDVAAVLVAVAGADLDVFGVEDVAEVVGGPGLECAAG